MGHRSEFRTQLEEAGLWEHYQDHRNLIRIETGVTGQKARRILQPYYLPLLCKKDPLPPNLPGPVEMLNRHQRGEKQVARPRKKKDQFGTKSDPWAGVEDKDAWSQLRWARDAAARASAGVEITPDDAPDAGSYFWFVQAKNSPKSFMTTFKDQLKDLAGNRNTRRAATKETARRISDLEARLAELDNSPQPESSPEPPGESPLEAAG